MPVNYYQFDFTHNPQHVGWPARTILASGVYVIDDDPGIMNTTRITTGFIITTGYAQRAFHNNAIQILATLNHLGPSLAPYVRERIEANQLQINQEYMFQELGFRIHDMALTPGHVRVWIHVFHVPMDKSQKNAYLKDRFTKSSEDRQDNTTYDESNNWGF